MNKKVVSLVTMSSIIFTSASPIFAKNFTSKQNIALDHAWTVKFNKELNSSQDFSKVTIKDNSGTTVPLDVTVNSDKQSVKVAPKENYSSNTNYTLTVDGIKDATGSNLKENATLSFTTVDPKPSDIIHPEFIQGAENRADRVWYGEAIGTKDADGNYVPFNSYTEGKTYTYDQANSFSALANYNSNYDDMNVICGLGWRMKFDQGKVYVVQTNPVKVTGDPYGTPNFSVSRMMRYTNPINSLAEKQIYTLISNVAKTDDVNGNKYTLVYNGGYNHYVAADNGKLVPIGTKYHEPTNFFLRLCSQEANSEGNMDDYADVEFLETPHIVNGTNYNLKFSINSSMYPVETKLLLDSIVGSKFGDDYSKILNDRYSQALHGDPAKWDGEFIVDGIKCCNDSDGMFISY